MSLSGIRTVRCLSIGGEISILLKDVLDVIGPFKTWAIVERRVETVIIHVRRQKCTIL
jgi:hypothetical protein